MLLKNYLKFVLRQIITRNTLSSPARLDLKLNNWRHRRYKNHQNSKSWCLVKSSSDFRWTVRTSFYFISLIYLLFLPVVLHYSLEGERNLDFSTLISVPKMASKLLMITIFVLDLVAFGLAIAAERRRSTVRSAFDFTSLYL